MVQTTTGSRGAVLSAMRQRIAQGQWAAGERLPPELDLAAELGVARGTIRKALALLTAEGLLQELPGTGRKLRGRVVAAGAGPAPGVADELLAATTVLLTACQDEPTLAPEAYAAGASQLAVDAAILHGLRQRGGHLLCLSSAQLDPQRLARVAGARPRGILLTAALDGERAYHQTLLAAQASGIPVVVAGDDPDLAFDQVGFDHRDGGRQLAEWLIARGCRRLCLAGVSTSESPWVRERLAGIDEACRAAGLPGCRQLHLRIEAVDDRVQPGFDRRVRQTAGFLAEHCLGASAVDAILAHNDWDAAFIAEALRLLGRDRIPVTGYDNHPGALHHPCTPLRPAATVDKHNPLLGETMLELLEARIDGSLDAAPVRRLVPARLLVLIE